MSGWRTLLPRLTLEEKVQQISGGGDSQLDVVDPTGTFTAQTARAEMMKSQDPENPFPVKRAAILRNAIQRYQMEKTRLGIPVIFPSEALHGYMEYGSTSFPQALAGQHVGSGVDKAVFTAVGDEAGSRGSGQVFSPVLDIARDPRWGRTEETYGEDPVSCFAHRGRRYRRIAGRQLPHRSPSRHGDRQAFRRARAA